MYTLFLRTIITYIILVGAIRLMGKRQIGELELPEFVITMLLSELAAVPIVDNTIPLTFSLIPVIILLSLEVIVSFISLKNRNLKRTIGESPCILIKKGKLCKEAMERTRIGIDALLCQLRLKNISDISAVEYAILEENGQISVIQNVKARNVTLEDLNINKEEKGMMHTIVADGQISDFNLKLIGHNRKWLYQQIKNKNTKLEDVFLFTVDDLGNTNFIKKGDTV